MWGEGSRRQRTGWETPSLGPEDPSPPALTVGVGARRPPEGWVLRGFEFPHTALQIQEAGQHFHFILPTPHRRHFFLAFSFSFLFFLLHSTQQLAGRQQLKNTFHFAGQRPKARSRKCGIKCFLYLERGMTKVKLNPNTSLACSRFPEGESM